MKRKIASVVGSIAFVTIMASASLASATTSSVGGGTWKYGTTGIFGGGEVYSEYLHQSKIHGASTINAKGSIKKHWNVGKGKWAYNTRQKAYDWQTDKAYWTVNS